MTLLTVEASGILLLCRWGEVVLLSLSFVSRACKQSVIAKHCMPSYSIHHNTYRLQRRDLLDMGMISVGAKR